MLQEPAFITLPMLEQPDRVIHYSCCNRHRAAHCAYSHPGSSYNAQLLANANVRFAASACLLMIPLVLTVPAPAPSCDGSKLSAGIAAAAHEGLDPESSTHTK